MVQRANVTESAPDAQFVRGSLQEVSSALQRLERRDQWLWVAALIVMILLTVTVGTFTLPTVLRGEDFTEEFKLGLAVRALFGLVLLFGVYVVYQQMMIRRLRSELGHNIDVLVRLQMRAEELQQLATLDPLTGLYNRRVAEQNLALEISRSGRHDYPLTLLALDLDGLKQVNDKHGHAAGDQMLKAFAGQLKKAIRSSDLAARVGGDEFVVILPECHPELVPRVLARLTGLDMTLDGTKIPIVFSAGWAGYQPGESPTQLLERADRALYSNKRTGKVEEQVRRAKDHMQKAQHMEALGRLVGGVVHDFNNLLMLIKGYSDMAIERVQDSDPLRPHLEEIRKASERANALTRQIFSFSRRQAVEPQAVNLNTIVKDLGLVLGRLLGESVELTLQLAPSLWTVRVDPGQMDQLLLNLATNAREAMGTSGRLTVETSNENLDESFVERHAGSRTGPYVRISVTDTGPGLNREERERIFEAGHGKGKAHRSNWALATAYGIVKQCGGYIAIQSQPGVGTTFDVYLPRMEEEAEAEVGGAATQEAESGQVPTVLVVEDEAALLNLTREFLETHGFHVLTAGDGVEALKVSDQHQGTIHIVLTDVVMPKMNGWELAKHLAIRRPGTKVLYVSGHADDAVVRQGLLDPDVPFLRKPFPLESLAQRLRELLQPSNVSG